MKTVVLDGYACNPGDLSWKELEATSDCVIYDRTTPEELYDRAKDAEIIITNKVCIDANIISQLPCLRYIGVAATGFNIVDCKAAKEHGIIVTNIPAYSTNAVAQMVFAHILTIYNHVEHYANEVRNGSWERSKDFCYFNTPLHELSGKTMGVIGLGNTGMATARIAIGFGMKVMAFTSKSDLQISHDIKKVGMDELFSSCDILSINCPLNDETKDLVNAEKLNMMKPTAIIINTARGGIVNAVDLAEALNSGKIAAAGMDVLDQEPPKGDNPLLHAKNCFITPHIAWASFESRSRLMAILTENVKAFISGKPQNVVS